MIRAKFLIRVAKPTCKLDMQTSAEYHDMHPTFHTERPKQHLKSFGSKGRVQYYSTLRGTFR